jgi:hypothetical protein
MTEVMTFMNQMTRTRMNESMNQFFWSDVRRIGQGESLHASEMKHINLDKTESEAFKFFKFEAKQQN